MIRLPQRLVCYSTVVLSCIVLLGCLYRIPERHQEDWTAPSPDVRWEAPPGALPPVLESPAPEIPEDLLAAADSWTLEDLVDVALRNNTDTRAAWNDARAAAATWGQEQSAYYPQLDAAANISRAQGSAVGGLFSYSQRSYGPSVEMTWLLFDFGGRRSAVDEKRNALLAADFSHNATIQRVVLAVQETYFQYVSSKALVKAAEASLNEARTGFEAAEARHEAGLATIADVLLAKTALSQAQLNLDGFRGDVQVIRGALATALGVPANTPFDVAWVEPPPALEEADVTVEACIEKAQIERPDLAAQRAKAEEAAARLRGAKAKRYPSLTFSGTAGRIYYDNSSIWANQYNGGVYLRVPLFQGYDRRYGILKAEAELEADRARVQSLEQQVILEVWTSYYDLKTAAQRVRTSEDLLKSAEQLYDVATGRYTEGVGGILDMLAARSSIENARAQRILAMTDWFLSLSRLAYYTGGLWRPGEDLPEQIPVTTEEGKP